MALTKQRQTAAFNRNQQRGTAGYTFTAT